ncbi:DUF2218 domain-containing protein [Acinetobacter wanghuae]|uniref:DUF2218 domain-containing protein n=1 Tax=Acinetobacter wanghuae TaxID=2662362 RepID=A0A5Q0P009_9GAMM|nr:DUF2218 domain-containing protein [Acinetobacter wanghuae]MQW93175.1 DUF2218 domain-containing protein [Acinetobacter wanghuae]QGA10399.1 DUF2218 domain-containing protein [Acinetobacter wanghuae]
MKSSAHIATLQAARIAKRLSKHWEHKFPVNTATNTIEIEMPKAQLRLSPTLSDLYVEIKAHDESVDLVHLQQVVINHLERMGNERLTTEWH